MGRIDVGTPPGEETIRQATDAFSLAGLEYAGFFTFPGQVYAAASEAEATSVAEIEHRAVSETLALASRAGFPKQGASGGTTPTSARLTQSTCLEEVRPGNYVFFDATQVAMGIVPIERCAFSVLTTIVAKPNPRRLILDAGSKAIAKDVMSPRTSGYAVVKGHPELVVTRLYEEHAIVDIPESASTELRAGDRVEVIPNHACVAANLHAAYALRDSNEVIDLIPLDARRD